MGRLPEAYIASRGERELRELVRHRAKLVALRSGLKAQVHGVLAEQGLIPQVADVFGVAGMAWLRTAPLDLVYRQRVLSRLHAAWSPNALFLVPAKTETATSHPLAITTAPHRCPGVRPAAA